MSTLMVGYDLNKPDKDYKPLIEAIKKLGTSWWHYLDSTWLVVTTKTTATARDELKKHTDGNDELLVMDVTGDGWSTTGFSKEATEWLQKHV